MIVGDCINRQRRARRCAGFSAVELMVVAVIAVVVAGFAIPGVLNAVHMARLRGTGSDFSSLLQSGRIRAVQDNRFYSIYILASAPQQAYVDLWPQNVDGTSGNTGTSVDAHDPAIVIPREVQSVAAGSAPNTANLKALFLPAGSSLVPNDANQTPITFSPRGLPCKTQNATGGTVCDSAGGAIASWAFFRNSLTRQWEAVTVSPSGRIQKWQYTTAWAKIS